MRLCCCACQNSYILGCAFDLAFSLGHIKNSLLTFCGSVGQAIEKYHYLIFFAMVDSDANASKVRRYQQLCRLCASDTRAQANINGFDCKNSLNLMQTIEHLYGVQVNWLARPSIRELWTCLPSNVCVMRNVFMATGRSTRMIRKLLKLLCLPHDSDWFSMYLTLSTDSPR